MKVNLRPKNKTNKFIISLCHFYFPIFAAIRINFTTFNIVASVKFEREIYVTVAENYKRIQVFQRSNETLDE